MCLLSATTHTVLGRGVLHKVLLLWKLPQSDTSVDGNLEVERNRDGHTMHITIAKTALLDSHSDRSEYECVALGGRRLVSRLTLHVRHELYRLLLMYSSLL